MFIFCKQEPPCLSSLDSLKITPKTLTLPVDLTHMLSQDVFYLSSISILLSVFPACVVPVNLPLIKVLLGAKHQARIFVWIWVIPQCWDTICDGVPVTSVNLQHSLSLT